MARSDATPLEGLRDETRNDDSPPSPPWVADHLRRRAWSTLAEGLGFALDRHDIPETALGTWGLDSDTTDGLTSLEVLAASPGRRLLLARGDIPYRCFRRMVLDAHRHNPSDALIWWWVRDTSLSIAIADRRPDGRRFVRRMTTSLEHPDPVSLRQWCELSIDDPAAPDRPDPARRTHRHVVDVLRQESLTRDFFEGFRDGLELLIDDMDDGPEDRRDRHDIALATLLRLVFVYFLQERGALDDDRRFVLRHLRDTRPKDESFYRHVLRPLFFGALNCTPDRRAPPAEQLGRLPFLNGGLFEPIPAELEYDDLDWPDDVWSTIVEDLLERFHFTIDEGAEDDECRAVDPEMLGKVFEGVMYGESRRESGSFYTPRDVVHRLVVRALTGHLTDATDVDETIARRLLEGESVEIDEDRRSALADALRDLRLLDPAVGTGAFLLEAMHRLDDCYRELGLTHDGDPRDAYERRIDIVHRHLFGVDLQQTAVRICELRLWLALLTAMPDVPIEDLPALPNLAHRIACGNSLLSPTDYAELEERDDGRTGPRVPLPESRRREYREDMRDLHESFLEARGDEKVEIRNRMESLERDIQTEILEERRRRLEARLEPLESCAASEDLFGRAVELSDEQREALETCRDELQSVESALDDLESHRESHTGFRFAARFGPAIDGDGFDVIVTNPPWVRANRLERSTRTLLKTRYEHVFDGLWPEASKLGIRTPFGPQVDLASVFVERSLELLRPGGRLSVLMPSKVFRSLHGAGFRRLVASHDLDRLEDYAEADRDWFDATVYPSVLHLAKSESQSEHAPPRHRRSPSASPSGHRATPDHSPRPQSFELETWRGDDSTTWQTRTEHVSALGDDPGEPWLFVPPRIQSAFETMREHGCSLGRIDALQPQRGIMTGCNRVFVRTPDALRDVLGDDATTWSRPILRGRDVRAWSVEHDERLVWGYDEHLEPQSELPERLHDYFETHADDLRNRADHGSGDELWSVFRLKKGIDHHKVVWRDLAPRLEAALAPPEVVPLNTVYFLPFETRRRARLLAALFNSRPLRAVARALGERARGGWRRHFAWVVRLLPIPECLARWLDAPSSSPPDSPALQSLLEACTPNDGDDMPPPRLDRRVGELFGLDASDLEALRTWNRASNTASRREAA